MGQVAAGIPKNFPAPGYNSATPAPEVRTVIAFSGDRSFPLPVPVVAAKLSDAGWLVGVLPDAHILSAAPDRAVWKLKPKLTFVTGHLDAAMDRTEHDPGQGVGFTVVTKAIGASSTVRTRLTFHAADDGTRVTWAGELTEVTGLLKMVPKGLLQATAEKVIGDVWAAVDLGLRDGGTQGLRDSGG
jgi:carbon monoxide dehydrogenase subunit G